MTMLERWFIFMQLLYILCIYVSMTNCCREKLKHYVVFNLLTSFYTEERLTTRDNKVLWSTARGIGNQNARASTFFSFIMCLRANNVQWIKPPVWRSRDNSDENTAKRLPASHNAVQRTRVRHVSSGWQMLSP